MATRSEQKERRREQILAIGLDLFVKKGLAATKVSDIAEAAGMSIGLLFHYFESKERLYEELVKNGIERSNAALSAGRVEPLRFFSEIASRILSDSHMAKMFVLMNQINERDDLPKNLRSGLWQDNLVASASIIRCGQKSGTIRRGDPLALSVAFWGTVQGICQIIVQDPNLPRPAAEWLTDILKKEASK